MQVIIKKIKWMLRRIAFEISGDALVLEVGSGGNPYPRSNVLLDAYVETRERHWDALVHDRPTVLSFGENLPFKDKVFDYVIAAHVLEHTPHPEKFLAELQRVAKAGYIETPDAFMERINPYKDHRLEVTVRDGSLVIRKKPDWVYDADLVQLYQERAKAIITRETIPRHAANFHMRYFWQDEIKFSVVNPEVDAGWIPPDSDSNTPSQASIKARFRFFILDVMRRLFSQRRRNARLNILDLLRCSKCQSDCLVRGETVGEIVCNGCNSRYRYSHNIFYMVNRNT